MSPVRRRLFGPARSDQRPRPLTVFGVALLFVALGVAVFLVYQNAGIMLKQIRDDFNQQQLILARQAAAQVNADLGDIEVAIESLAHNLPEGGVEADGYGLRAFFEWGRPKGVLAISVVSADGRVVAGHHDPEIDVQVRGLTACPPGPADRTVFGPLRMDLAAPDAVIVTSDLCHHLGPAGQAAGLLHARLDVTRLLSRAMAPIRSGRTGYAWAIDGEGVFLYHPDQEFIGRSAFEARHERQPYISFSEINHIMKDQMLLGQEGMGVYLSGWHRGVEGQIQKLIAFTPVPSAALR